MRHTKNALVLLGAVMVLALWAAAHSWVWNKLVGDLPGLFGSIFTGAVIPLLAIALYQDWKEPKP